MNYILKPSLEHIVLAKIAAGLWNQEDIRDLMKKICTPFDSKKLIKEWPQIEITVKEKITHLPLPELLKEKVIGVIKPIGSQISRWIWFYGDYFLSTDLPNEFCWTPQGTVDEKKTAELLIKDESIGIMKRYQVSCTYCLQKDILKLWNKLPEDCKKNFYNEKDPIYVEEPDLVDFWTYDIKGELNKIKICGTSEVLRGSPYQYACIYAAFDGNKAATEYFLQKLTSSERKHSLIEIVECMSARRQLSHTLNLYDYYSDIVCTSLLHMEKEQQNEVFQSSLYAILPCFLNWPWQSFFAETASHMWTFMSDIYFPFLLRIMLLKVTDGFKDFNYQKLLAENWQQSPNAFKRSFLLNCKAPYILSMLFELRDLNNIKLILNYATITEKQKIISSEKGHDICKDLIDGEEWNLLKFFIQDCMSSRDEMVKLKADFQKRFSFITLFLEKDAVEKMKHKWDKFFSLLDDITYESNKRKFMENDDIKAKRLVT